MTTNNYFQVLPKEVQQALGKAAYDTFLHFNPPFAFTGKWEDVKPDMKARWLAVVEAIFNELQGLEEHVTTRMELFDVAHSVLDEAIKRFEAIRPEDTHLNNYQLLEWLRSAFAEVTNARLLMLRADIAAGNVQHEGDESTLPVNIPNVRLSE